MALGTEAGRSLSPPCPLGPSSWACPGAARLSEASASSSLESWLINTVIIKAGVRAEPWRGLLCWWGRSPPPALRRPHPLPACGRFLRALALPFPQQVSPQRGGNQPGNLRTHQSSNFSKNSWMQPGIKCVLTEFA